MKIQIASDLHLKLHPHHELALHNFLPFDDRDVLLLASDIGTHITAWSFIKQELRRSPVIHVALLA